MRKYWIEKEMLLKEESFVESILKGEIRQRKTKKFKISKSYKQTKRD